MTQHLNLYEVQRVNHRRAVEDTLAEPELVGKQVAVRRDLRSEIDGIAPLLVKTIDQRRRCSGQGPDIFSPDTRLSLRKREAEQSQIAP